MYLDGSSHFYTRSLSVSSLGRCDLSLEVAFLVVRITLSTLYHGLALNFIPCQELVQDEWVSASIREKLLH